MKETLFLVAIVIGLVAFIVHKDNDFKTQCRASGGTPVIGQYNNTCLAPGVAIDLD